MTRLHFKYPTYKTMSTCSRLANLPVSIPADVEPLYARSQPQVPTHMHGTFSRTGVCSECDAAIYRKEALGGRFPKSLVGSYYHAVSGGLVKLPA